MEKEKNLEDKLSVFEKITYSIGSVVCGGTGTGIGVLSYGMVTKGIEELTSKYRGDYIDAGFLLTFGAVTAGMALASAIGTAYLAKKAVIGKKKSC